MSRLSIDQKSVSQLFEDKQSDFLIPDYQRPYAWTTDECATLWDDIVSFAIPEGNKDAFDKNEQYFLGPIVTFRNTDDKLEIIDGQQRLTTLMLMLRSFYSKFSQQKDDESVKTREKIERCIWQTDEFGSPNKDQLKIDSEVASDDDKNEFLTILKTGEAQSENKSKYADSFRFFSERIDDFVGNFPSYLATLAIRVLNNVILLPIEAETQNTALRIFSTLNDRGLPLSDADIFKSQFYKYFSDLDEKTKFISRWKKLEDLSNDIFEKSRSHPMDELFTRYMYFRRAKQGNRSTTTEGLRDFFERDSYKILKSETTLTDLEELASFWQQVENREDFNDDITRQLYILSFAPNRMWTYIVSVFFMNSYERSHELNSDEFLAFLRKLTAFLWAHAVIRPGVNALRTPLYPAMIEIVNDRPVNFNPYRFNRQELTSTFKTYSFTNQRPITKSMLIWWAMEHEKQDLAPIGQRLEVEHIFPRRRAQEPGELADQQSLDSLGNKAMMEKALNIRASDYRWPDKSRYYLGIPGGRGARAVGTNNVELKALAKREDFNEHDIGARKEQILTRFFQFLDEEGLFED